MMTGPACFRRDAVAMGNSDLILLARSCGLVDHYSYAQTK